MTFLMPVYIVQCFVLKDSQPCFFTKWARNYMTEPNSPGGALQNRISRPTVSFICSVASAILFTLFTVTVVSTKVMSQEAVILAVSIFSWTSWWRCS